MAVVKKIRLTTVHNPTETIIRPICPNGGKVYGEVSGNTSSKGQDWKIGGEINWD